MSLNKNAPCFNCKKRKVGYHADCEPYLDFAKRTREMHEKERLERSSYSVVIWRKGAI